MESTTYEPEFLSGVRATFDEKGTAQGAAHSDNVELGLIVHGGPVPQQLEKHFRTLITNDIQRVVHAP